MDNTKQNHPKIQSFSCSQEDKSNGCEFRNMSEQEQDIICRMHKLVGNKWELIAGRIPGRTAEEIERFWLMKNNSDSFKGKRIQQTRKHDNS